jgi:hypothetical protein
MPKSSSKNSHGLSKHTGTTDKSAKADITQSSKPISGASSHASVPHAAKPQETRPSGDHKRP